MSVEVLRRDGLLELRRLVVGPLQTNTYLLSCTRTGHTAVIDPGDDEDSIFTAVGRRSVVAVLLTHAHWDHVQAADAVRLRYAAPLAAHPEERRVWQHELQHLNTHGQWDWALAATRMPAAAAGVPVAGWDGHIDITAEHGDQVRVGDLIVSALHTPGHTPGSLCFSIDGELLTGDTLFPGGPGLTGWPLSDFDEIMQSIEDRIFGVYADGRVHPGHGPATSLSKERPSLEIWRDRRW